MYSNSILQPFLGNHKNILGKRKLFSDILFFIFFVALPTSFFAFLPEKFFFDIDILYWSFGMLYGILYFKYIKKISHLPGGKLLIFVVLFTILRFGYSILIDNISLQEVVTVFRTNFYYPIPALGFLLYTASMDNRRINRFLYWLYYITLYLGILYIVSNLTSINFYAVVSKKDSEEFLLLGQNLAAMPKYLNILFAVGLFTAFTLRKAKFHLLWAVPLILTIISIARNQIVVFILMLLLFILLGYFYFQEIRLGRIVKIGLLLLFASLAVGIAFSNHFAAVINKFGFNQNEQVQVSDYTEKGNYWFRLQLIEEAYIRTETNGKLLLGNGYQREASSGEYDFVLGGDTLVAPILFAEGFLGLFIRLMPIFFFLWFGIKKLGKHNSPYQYIALITIIIIIPAIINGVQTIIFTRYTEELFIFYLFMQYIYNQQKAAKQYSNIDIH